MTTENNTNNANRPLWMPPGSVRAIMALGIWGIIGWMLFVRIPVPDWLYAIAGTTTAFYFGTKAKT